MTVILNREILAPAVLLNLVQHPAASRLADGELDPETSSG
jgi:hypothetical protein